MSNKANPYLFFKYNQGLGDFIASLLHSSAFGWLTKLLTGKKEPCNVCSKRADALNVLFPIPFWRIFFKKREDMIASLKQDLLDKDYEISVSEDGTSIASVKKEFIPVASSTNFNPFSFPGEEKLSKYDFISSNDKEIDHLLIRTQIYKLKS